MQQAISTQDIRAIGMDTYATKASEKTGLLKRFLQWCDRQENDRLLWLGISVLGGIATVLPITLIAVVFLANNSFALWAIACTVNVPVLIVNLAAQPTKIILPVTFFVWFINLLIILYTVAAFFGVVPV
jgi:hypothetical protein